MLRPPATYLVLMRDAPQPYLTPSKSSGLSGGAT